MICQRCLFRLQRRTLVGGSSSSSSSVSVRTYALKSEANRTVPAPNPAKPRGPGTETHEGHPVATSSTAAQPFSARENDRQKTSGSPPKLEPSGSIAEIESKLPQVPSSLPGGKPMKALGYLKNKEPPVALEDDEYPPWLWTLLDQAGRGKSGDAEAGGDIFSKSKAKRKKALKAARDALKKGITEEHLPKVPIEQQSIDLPTGDGTLAGAVEADTARENIRQAMRRNRRVQIRNSNHLKTLS